MALFHGFTTVTNSLNITNIFLFPTTRGVGTIFFWGGGKDVDIPSDCQNVGGGEQAYPSHWEKSVVGRGNCPPPAPAPLPITFVLPDSAV